MYPNLDINYNYIFWNNIINILPIIKFIYSHLELLSLGQTLFECKLSQIHFCLQKNQKLKNKLVLKVPSSCVTQLSSHLFKEKLS